MNAPVWPGMVIAERYRVESLLGEGGMGYVVKATHLLLQQLVAIKFLRREAADAGAVHRLLLEARAAAKVQSEHVVRIHDVAALEDGTPYIVMEYLEGSDLASLLTKGPLPVHDAIRYAIQTCQALGETHASGIVHGDLKPENIYIVKAAEGGGRVKLLDFGISKGVGGKTPKSAPLMGTPAYMAPEQFESGVVEPRTDLWSLGAVLYEMLTGVQAFAAEAPEAIAKRVVAGAPTPIQRPNVPPELEALVLRCLSKDPKQRYGSAVELAFALEAFAPAESSAVRLARVTSQRSPTGSQRLVPTVVVSKRPNSRGGGWLVPLAAAFAIVAAVLFLSMRRARPLAAEPSPSPAPMPTPEQPAAKEPARVEIAPVATVPPAPAPTTLPSPSTLPSSAAAKSVALTPPRAPRPPPKRPSPPSEPRRPGASGGGNIEPAPPPPSPTAAETDRYGTRK